MKRALSHKQVSSKGGRASARAMTPEQRTERAKKAAAARENGKKGGRPKKITSSNCDW